jgi:hypothetical protein
MKRAIRDSILRAVRSARGQRHGWAYPVTVTVDVPAAATAGAPVWVPPGYTEIATARRWARPDAPGLFHAIVTTFAPGGGTVLASGLVTPENLLGLGGLCDKPHRIRWQAMPGTLDEQVLDGSHPAAAYQAWVDRAEQAARDVLFPGLGHSTASNPLSDSVAFEHCPGGSWRVVIHADLDREPGILHDDVDLTADAIACLARHYGAGTRVRAYPWDTHQGPYEVTEPAYAAAVTAFWKPGRAARPGPPPQGRRTAAPATGARPAARR